MAKEVCSIVAYAKECVRMLEFGDCYPSEELTGREWIWIVLQLEGICPRKGSLRHFLVNKGEFYIL